MTTSEKTTLKQLVTRLHEQSLEMATLRAALEVQFTRIAQMQAELDLLPHARKRRQALRVLLSEAPVHISWDGPERRHGQSTEVLRAHLRELRVAWETGPERVPRDSDEEHGAPRRDPSVTVTAKNPPASLTAPRRGRPPMPALYPGLV